MGGGEGGHGAEEKMKESFKDNIRPQRKQFSLQLWIMHRHDLLLLVLMEVVATCFLEGNSATVST